MTGAPFGVDDAVPTVTSRRGDSSAPSLLRRPRRSRRRRAVAMAAVIGLPMLIFGGGSVVTGIAPAPAWLDGSPGSNDESEPPAQAANTAAPATAPSALPSPTPSGPLVGGWYAGASGLGVSEGAFQRWLGQRVTIAGTWADQDARAQERLTPLGDEYRSWRGALDIAIGGTVLGSGETYAAAARGAYDARWRKAAKTLAARRGKLAAPTFVRTFHEMNGFWYRNWAVNTTNVRDYKAAHARFVRILRQAMPTVYVSWSPNFRDHSGMPIDEWYPGDDVVDCIAPDYYNDTPQVHTVQSWNAASDDVDRLGNPLGPEAWRRFALAHGKPVCFAETGLKPVGGITDQPQWVTAFNRWLNTHANATSWRLGEPIPAAAAGKVLYTVYFNVPHDGRNGFTIYGRGANPKSAKVFRSLTWGRPVNPPGSVSP